MMKSNQHIKRYLYAGFCLMGLYYFFKGNYGETAIFLGIALAFDPFDPTITWKERPLWQRAWLIVHLAACAAAFGFEVGTNDGLKQGFNDGWNQR